ncbi:low-specificity L-threonine aldolase [Agarivorans sp. MS3-6]|uniref:low-specificity L-threonine aldolase n=1 Tax=Agarivorans sp. TSD2052 TaxID=2937286 RepID=UPI00200ED74A|nr:low-specificity L-threonine aldolase [Agarivorans sp. TSD2052]UPW17380.1 low-specificity L-threonine aldolase [Agarivorans sp. TSD2052]
MSDFRSDTVTQPTPAMRELMSKAAVGDDVYGDDPTVNRLQSYAAERMGKQAALFCSSGTQANLLAIMAHCQRGDEYICGQNAHNYKYEGGGAAVLGSVQPQPVENNADGSLCLNKVKAAIKADDFHFAKTHLLSLENTIGGKVLPMDYVASLRPFVEEHQLALHLDGARIFNAIVKTGQDERHLVDPFDSFTICLSKGLGAPIGSLLLGSEELIAKATRIRKMLGGGMRQAGIIAAAGHYVLENNVARLADDHANARYLAEQLASIEELECDASAVQTNIVYASCRKQQSVALAAELAEQGILMTAGSPMRFVTHLNVNQQDIQRLVVAVKKFYASH